MFRLSDEQWALIQPLLPPSALSSRGRPVMDQRLVLEGILWKFSTHSPWYDMPPAYPSYQTCYRRYLLWKRTGLLHQIYHLLYRDLRERGRFDIHRAIIENRIRLSRVNNRWAFIFPPELENTWQIPVARLIIYHWLEEPRRTLKKEVQSKLISPPGL
jgi:transposase